MYSYSQSCSECLTPLVSRYLCKAFCKLSSKYLHRRWCKHDSHVIFSFATQSTAMANTHNIAWSLCLLSLVKFLPIRHLGPVWSASSATHTKPWHAARMVDDLPTALVVSCGTYFNGRILRRGRLMMFGLEEKSSYSVGGANLRAPVWEATSGRSATSRTSMREEAWVGR